MVEGILKAFEYPLFALKIEQMLDPPAQRPGVPHNGWTADLKARTTHTR